MEMPVPFGVDTHIKLNSDQTRWSESFPLGDYSSNYCIVRIYVDGYGLVLRSPYNASNANLQLYGFVSDLHGTSRESIESLGSRLAYPLMKVRPRVDFRFSNEITCFSPILDEETPLDFGYDGNYKWSAGFISEFPDSVFMMYRDIPIFGVNPRAQIFYYNEPYVLLDKGELHDGPAFV